jgi:polyhydroxyalkanoate synthesis regulator phasin
MEDKMIDVIKKAVLTGIGIASLTKDKVEDLAKDLIDKGKMSEQEGEKLVQEMLSRAEESRQTMKNQTETLVQKTIDKMRLARMEDIELLKKEIETLRAEISDLQKSAGQGEAAQR